MGEIRLSVISVQARGVNTRASARKSSRAHGVLTLEFEQIFNKKWVWFARFLSASYDFGLDSIALAV